MTRPRGRSTFDEIIASGRRPAGAFVMSSDSSVTALYGDAGYDFVVIDREHGIMDNSDMLAHIRAATASGLIPFVRVLENNASLIQQTLDAGAHGIIVPKVGSADDARRAVAATLYQPGGRGMCPVVPATSFTQNNWHGHRETSNSQVILMPLIETKRGVDNIEEIMAVEGVDHVFFGLADLSQDLGIDMIADGDQLVAHWTTVANAAHAAGGRAGAPLGYGFDELADFGSLDGDLSSLRTAADSALSTYRANEMPLGA